MEEFYPGDKVEFVDDNTRGVVAAIVDKNLLMVTLENGLTIPVIKTQVIKITGTATNPQSLEEKYEVIENKQDTSYVNQAEAVKLAFLPDETNRQYSLFLINNTEDGLFFTLYQSSDAGLKLTAKGELNAGGFALLVTFKKVSANKLPDFTFCLLRYKFHITELIKPVIFTLKPTEEGLSRKIEYVREIGKEASVVYIIKNEVKFSDSKLELPEKRTKERIQVEKPPDVVDLHIEKICEDYQKMTRAQIFEYQYNYFINALEKAHAFKYRRIIFLHGIGVSSLKSRITDYLKKQDYVKAFRDADVFTYGYGATEVEFK